MISKSAGVKAFGEIRGEVLDPPGSRPGQALRGNDKLGMLPGELGRRCSYACSSAPGALWPALNERVPLPARGIRMIYSLVARLVFAWVQGPGRLESHKPW